MSHRFHIDGLPAKGSITLPAEVVRHLHVLKVSAGDEVTLFDGAGREARARIEHVTHSEAEATVLERIEVTREGALALTLACAVPKGRRMDTLVRMVAELGTSTLIPMVTERSVVKPHGANKLDRWRKICVAAGEQSRRNVLMKVTEPTTTAEVLDEAGTYDLVVILSPDESAQPIPQVLDNHANARTVLMLIGPEGGFTDAELTQAREAGAIPARLTRSVLRIETAVVAAAAVVMTG
jgi:16S rRNA (uracil1498-N3)-methyltransferase